MIATGIPAITANGLWLTMPQSQRSLMLHGRVALAVMLAQGQRRRHDSDHTQYDQNPSHATISESCAGLPRLVMVALFARGNGDGQTILHRR